jgi:hypothetical protein
MHKLQTYIQIRPVILYLKGITFGLGYQGVRDVLHVGNPHYRVSGPITWARDYKIMFGDPL